MATKSDLRFVANFRGTPKRLLSVAERSKGDLVVSLRAAQFFRATDNIENPFKGQDAHHGKEIFQQKYSVHMSVDSPQHINQIQHHIQFTDKTFLRSSHFTKALKHHDKFAPIFLRIFPDLRLPHYDAPHEDKNIALFDFPEKMFVPTMMIFVANRDRLFRPKKQVFYNFIQIPYSHFSIVIAYTFIPGVPHPFGRLSHCLTIDQKTDPPAEYLERSNTVANGFDEDQCTDLFFQILSESRDIYYDEIIAKEGPDDELMKKFHERFKVMGYFRNPDYWDVVERRRMSEIIIV